MEEHPSIPFNPDIATAFFRAGLIEAWGRGSLKIVRERKEARLPAPIFTYDLSGFRIEFKKEAGKSSDEIRCSIFPFCLGDELAHFEGNQWSKLRFARTHESGHFFQQIGTVLITGFAPVGVGA